MEPIDYLRIIRRRWPLLAILVVVGMAVGFVTDQPASSAPTATAGPLRPSYQAQAILGVPSSVSDPTGLSLDAMVFLATSGPVPAMTAKALGRGVRASDVAGQVQVQAKDSLAVIQVSAAAASAAGAATLSNTYSQQFIAFLNNQLVVSYQGTLAADRAQLAALGAVVSQLQAQPTSAVVQSEVNQAVTQDAQQEVAYQQLVLIGPQHTGLHVIDPASASTAVAGGQGGGVARAIVGTSRKNRVALGGLAGLLVGIGLALVWERLDPRIRTREQAEKTFGLPVLAEIPRAPHGSAAPTLTVVDDPLSPAAESYRMLQTVLALSHAPGGEVRAGAILLCSPAAFPGKDVVAANLAATFSEAGSSVALVSVDSSDRSLLALLGSPAQPVAAPELYGGEPATRRSSTSIEGVSVLTNGLRPGAGHATRHADMVATGRRLADVVLVDTPPVLTAHDASRLSAAADSVVLLCEVGRVTPRQAAVAVEALRRVDAPLQGVVLVVTGGWAGRRSRPRPAPAAPTRSPSNLSRAGGTGPRHAAGRRDRRDTPAAGQRPPAGNDG